MSIDGMHAFEPPVSDAPEYGPAPPDDSATRLAAGVGSVEPSFLVRSAP